MTFSARGGRTGSKKSKPRGTFPLSEKPGDTSNPRTRPWNTIMVECEAGMGSLSDPDSRRQAAGRGASGCADDLDDGT